MIQHCICDTVAYLMVVCTPLVLLRRITLAQLPLFFQPTNQLKGAHFTQTSRVKDLNAQAYVRPHGYGGVGLSLLGRDCLVA